MPMNVLPKVPVMTVISTPGFRPTDYQHNDYRRRLLIADAIMLTFRIGQFYISQLFVHADEHVNWVL